MMKHFYKVMLGKKSDLARYTRALSGELTIEEFQRSWK